MSDTVQERLPGKVRVKLPSIFKGRSTIGRRDNLVGYLFLSPWLIGFFLFTFLPIVASFVLAFTDYDIFTAPEWVGLDNFHKMFFQDRRYWKSVKATFYYVFTAVPLRLLAALAVAMLLHRGRRLVSVYRAAYYAPSIVGGSVAVAVMWRQIFGVNGLINFLLAALGLPADIVWLGDVRTAIWTLITLAAWQFGSPMLIFLAGLKQIPGELYDAASIDGAGGWAKFAKITLPMLTPVIFFNLVMQTIAGFMAFTQAYLVTNRGRPLDTTNFYALYLYLRAFENHQMGYASAMAWVLLLIIAFFTALIFRSSQYWVYYVGGERER